MQPTKRTAVTAAAGIFLLCGSLGPVVVMLFLLAACLIGLSGLGGVPSGTGNGPGCTGTAAGKQDLKDCLARRPAIPGAGPVVSGDWALPLAQGSYVVGSGFKDPNRGGRHFGVDFIAARFTPIYAASTGMVLRAGCSQATIRTAGSCDIDGSASASGCGWFVEILHADQIATMYCHLAQRPLVTDGQQVTPGQSLGEVGSSGNSSGPHLHFQVHTGGTTTNASAIDPVAFLRSAGLDP